MQSQCLGFCFFQGMLEMSRCVLLFLPKLPGLRFQVSEQPLWKCPSEQLTNQCVPIQSDLKSVLQPPLTPELCAGLPLMRTSYKPSQLRKSPLQPAFICRYVGEWWKLGFLERLGMERIETKTSPCREPMSLFLLLFPFIPRAPVRQREREREHI